MEAITPPCQTNPMTTLTRSHSCLAGPSPSVSTETEGGQTTNHTPSEAPSETPAVAEMQQQETGQQEDLAEEVFEPQPAAQEQDVEMFDLQRRMEVLTEFFNKKEAELQRQLGLQSAKFGDVSTDAESSARQLVSVSSELDATRDQVRIIKTELEDQERSLKAAVATQEKKAHENWVAAR